MQKNIKYYDRQQKIAMENIKTINGIIEMVDPEISMLQYRRDANYIKIQLFFQRNLYCKYLMDAEFKVFHCLNIFLKKDIRHIY